MCIICSIPLPLDRMENCQSHVMWRILPIRCIRKQWVAMFRTQRQNNFTYLYEGNVLNQWSQSGHSLNLPLIPTPISPKSCFDLLLRNFLHGSVNGLNYTTGFMYSVLTNTCWRSNRPFYFTDAYNGSLRCGCLSVWTNSYYIRGRGSCTWSSSERAAAFSYLWSYGSIWERMSLSSFHITIVPTSQLHTLRT